MAAFCHTEKLAMAGPESRFEQAAFYLTCATAIAVLLSTAAYFILLAASVAALVASRRPIKIPPPWRPLALFMALTVISLLLSPEPRAGLPQLKKFLVFLAPVVMYTVVTRLSQVRALILAWGVAAALSGLWALVQFVQKHQQAAALGRDFYVYYVPHRITGFMSHWMTFGGEQMLALTMIASLLLAASVLTRRERKGLSLCALVIASSVLLGLTRSVWIATAVSLGYLVARWRPKLLIGLPVAIAVILLLAPSSVANRALSIVRPGKLDSNEHRRVTWRTGIEMIKAHPWFGVGPMQVGKEFKRYLPADITSIPEGYYDHLHSIYLHYAAERGVPAMLALLWFLGRLLVDFWRAGQMPAIDSTRRAILFGAFACVCAVMIEGFAELNLGDSEVLTMCLLVVAWGYTAAAATKPCDARLTAS
jgi:O-antigen ligase